MNQYDYEVQHRTGHFIIFVILAALLMAAAIFSVLVGVPLLAVALSLVGLICAVRAYGTVKRQGSGQTHQGS